jgi:hypothetical protein
VKYLPSSVTTLVQPMDHRVIATMQRHNRESILQNYTDEGSDLKMFWKRLSLLDAMYEVSHAWNMVKPLSLTSHRKDTSRSRN